jgi:hypothetical protein
MIRLVKKQAKPDRGTIPLPGFLRFKGIREENTMKINVLGTEYEIVYRGYDELRIFENEGIEAYCESIRKMIVIGKIKTFPGYEHESMEYCIKCEEEALRHEIVHAFLNESGLQECAFTPKGGWARNEEMVDWIALQFPKLLEAMKAAGCL